MKKLHHPRQAWSWALYDWANSSFTTVILTFVYATYFVKSVAEIETYGTAWWGYALSLSGLGLAILGPLCGAIADHMGRLKRWTFLGMVLCIGGTLVMGLAPPAADHSLLILALGALVVANLGFEMSIVFNNALLPEVAQPDELGKVSSLAWGIGYFGGLLSLVVVLFGLIGLGDIRPLIDLPDHDAIPVRSCVIVVAVWYALFALPFFLFVPDRPASQVTTREALRLGFISLKKNIADLWRDRSWGRFMIGSAIYRDGLTTLFSMGGIYAAAQYDMKTADILVFGIGINVTSGLGCILAAFLEDRFGSLKTVRWSLICLIVVGIAVLLAPDKDMFLLAALILGFFVGPVQSASRTLVARISKPDEVTERYGLYALTGRAVAFLGPLAFALATDWFGTEQAGMATILLFWVIGLMLIKNLRD